MVVPFLCNEPRQQIHSQHEKDHHRWDHVAGRGRHVDDRFSGGNPLMVGRAERIQNCLVIHAAYLQHVILTGK